MRQFACDGLIVKENKILLIKRGAPPFLGFWAIPGGRIEENEDAIACLKREMKEETNLVVEPISLLGIYSDPKRDPRKTIVATYVCKIISGEIKAGDDAAEIAWFDLDKLPKLAFDHEKMVRDYLKSEQSK